MADLKVREFAGTHEKWAVTEWSKIVAAAWDGDTKNASSPVESPNAKRNLDTLKGQLHRGMSVVMEEAGFDANADLRENEQSRRLIDKDSLRRLAKDNQTCQALIGRLRDYEAGVAAIDTLATTGQANYWETRRFEQAIKNPNRLSSTIEHIIKNERTALGLEKPQGRKCD